MDAIIFIVARPSFLDNGNIYAVSRAKQSSQQRQGKVTASGFSLSTAEAGSKLRIRVSVYTVLQLYTWQYFFRLEKAFWIIQASFDVLV